MGLWWTKIFCSNFGHLAANPASTCTQKFYREEGLFTRFVKLITTAGVWACGEKCFGFFTFHPPQFDYFTNSILFIDSTSKMYPLELQFESIDDLFLNIT